MVRAEPSLVAGHLVCARLVGLGHHHWDERVNFKRRKPRTRVRGDNARQRRVGNSQVQVRWRRPKWTLRDTLPAEEA